MVDGVAISELTTLSSILKLQFFKLFPLHSYPTSKYQVLKNDTISEVSDLSLEITDWEIMSKGTGYTIVSMSNFNCPLILLNVFFYGHS
jgi:hypothetical protein